MIQNHTRLVHVSAIALALCIALTAHLPRASAQLLPERVYYGHGRTIPMQVVVPGALAGEVTIELLAPNTAERVDSAPAAEGAVDLAGLFPSIWTTDRPRLLYAQLRVGEEPIGSAVVLQPMLAVPYAERTDQTGRPQFTSSPGLVYSGIRAYPEKHVVLETTHGDMHFRLRPDHAPNTVWNFLHLVEGGFYTDIVFHRVIGSRGGQPPFVIQVGDPTGTGMGGPGYLIDLEPSRLRHDFGVLSMARSSNPNSNGSQVFVCLSRAATQALDDRYTAFGELVSGADAVVQVSKVPTGPQDRPLDPMPRIVRAYTVDAPPYGTGPKPEQSPGDGTGER
ncbi:MAG: hypothetical protein AMXMBFR77_15460 [Phycisphaerales bacterium]|nr:peptidylprolyl isomerase [Phycisphaerales bacterium]GIK19111.1 MAG: hypothetical protein BroJett004_12750 [Planctomycetota bacterium]